MRHFAATAFVVWRGRVLLHRHKKHGTWLPCGGHIDEGELPDDAAVREVYEESGVPVVLVGGKALNVEPPRQLIRPRGVQLETIGPGHEHIDLIYFAVPAEGYDGSLREDDDTLGWYGEEELESLELTPEIRAWIRLALTELSRTQ
jgi:8-oxo-dGTP pyrophosphatase MutT (NUDIX family)